MHISVMFRRVVSFIASLFMDMCAAENPFERMRHSANVSYFQQFTFFSFLGVCVCLCCRFVDGVVVVCLLFFYYVYFCRWKSEHFYFAYHPHLLYFFIYFASFIVVVFIQNHIRRCFTILKPFAVVRTKWIGCLSFFPFSVSLSLCILPYSLALLLLYFSSENDTTGAIVRNIIMQFY